ncbi:hypothetical protein HanRHA438_Chr08g0365551 [Helianthus annuus]|nr:hypothetical protein HanRHA438_Chr08g0365551 [Helianthus annuus]
MVLQQTCVQMTGLMCHWTTLLMVLQQTCVQMTGLMWCNTCSLNMFFFLKRVV